MKSGRSRFPGRGTPCEEPRLGVGPLLLQAARRAGVQRGVHILRQPSGAKVEHVEWQLEPTTAATQLETSRFLVTATFFSPKAIVVASPAPNELGSQSVRRRGVWAHVRRATRWPAVPDDQRRHQLRGHVRFQDRHRPELDRRAEAPRTDALTRGIVVLNPHVERTRTARRWR